MKTDDDSALVVSDVQKTFGRTHALRGVHLSVARGEVHALLGHNGSGKSTLVKAIAGVLRPDSGAATVDGAPLTLGDARSAHAAGLRFVHQDLAVVDALDAVDNFALGVGFDRSRIGTIAWRTARARTERALAELGQEFDVGRPAGLLLPSERACLAIARALQDWNGAARVLVLDEPTAAMPAAEVQKLFGIVGVLRARGLAIIFVTHHLDEVLEIADRATVLRNGENVGTQAIEGTTHAELVRLILGADSALHEAAAAGRPTSRIKTRDLGSGSEPVLKVAALTTDRLERIDFAVEKGEILGIAGLSGSGREDVLPALAGAIPRLGSVQVRSVTVKSGRVNHAIGAGVAYVPADRARNGLFPDLDLAANTTIARLQTLARFGFVRSRSEIEDVVHWARTLDVRPADPRYPVTGLSGGNQQKVMLGRWLGFTREVILLDEPTQGVDVGARVAIHDALRTSSASAAVVVASSDADELATLCDRVLVLARGRIVAELNQGHMTAGQIDARSMDADGPAIGAQRGQAQ
jgi:ribose transport system ATP-binding protein